MRLLGKSSIKDGDSSLQGQGRVIVKDAIKITFSTYVSNAVYIVLSFTIRKVLGPSFMGIYSILNLIREYARHHHFGIIYSLDRQIPYFVGKKDVVEVKRVKEIAFTVALLTSLLVSIGIAISSFFISPAHGKELIWGIRLVSVLAVLQYIVTFYKLVVRAHKNFTLLSNFILFNSIFETGLKILLLLKFGFYGLLWGSIFSMAAGGLFLFLGSREKYSLKFDFRKIEISRLVKIGFPMLLSSFIFETIMSIDRFFVIGYLGIASLGIYSIAIMMRTYISQFPMLLCNVVSPRFYESYGKSKDIKELKGYFETPILIFSYFFPIILGLVVITMPVLIFYLLPKFYSGLLPAKILIMSTFFYLVINMSEYTLIAVSKQHRIIFIGVIAILIGAVVNYLFIKVLKQGLNGAAISTVITYFIYSTILLFTSYRNYSRRVFEQLKFFLRIYFPLIWSVAGLVFISRKFQLVTGVLGRDLFYTLSASICFLITVSPLIYWVNKRTNILKLIFAPKTIFEKNGY